MYLFVDYKFSSSSFSGSFSGQVDSAAALDAYLAWPFFGPDLSSRPGQVEKIQKRINVMKVNRFVVGVKSNLPHMQKEEPETNKVKG